MLKVSEYHLNKSENKRFKVVIEKLRTNTSTYKFLKFSIFFNGKLLYKKSDIKSLHD